MLGKVVGSGQRNILGCEIHQRSRRLRHDPGARAQQTRYFRGDLAVSNRFNLIHGSDTIETAEREVRAFFSEDELVRYDEDATRWIYDQSGSEPV